VDVYGSDYNEDLVAWCRRRLTFASVKSNGLAPPLAFPNDSFALPLRFQTHLDEPLQTPWIEELERVAKPGGQILITVKGNAVDLRQLRPDLRYLRLHVWLRVGHGTEVASLEGSAHHRFACIEAGLFGGIEGAKRPC
jgi:hypothetical protein